MSRVIKPTPMRIMYGGATAGVRGDPVWRQAARRNQRVRVVPENFGTAQVQSGTMMGQALSQT